MSAVYKAICKVTQMMCKDGISKDRKNQQQGYSFRGIDDVYNALAPMLSEVGLCILPRMLSRTVIEHQSAKGTLLFYVTVEAEFDFVAAEDGSKHTVKTYGEAMDSGDKATNKAMSAAYKYAAFQTFCIPTEGDNDADASTHTVKPKATITPTTGALDNITAVQRTRLESVLSSVLDCYNAGMIDEAYAAYMEVTDTDEKVALRELMKGHSKVRTALTAKWNSMKRDATQENA